VAVVNVVDLPDDLLPSFTLLLLAFVPFECPLRMRSGLYTCTIIFVSLYFICSTCSRLFLIPSLPK